MAFSIATFSFRSFALSLINANLSLLPLLPSIPPNYFILARRAARPPPAPGPGAEEIFLFLGIPTFGLVGLTTLRLGGYLKVSVY